MIRVLLVDDHSLVLDGLTARLQRCEHIEIVGQASDGREGIALAERLQPDVVLMDINMPTLSGIEAAEILGEGPGDTALIILALLANGLSSREMADKLRISVRTVETHRRNIKQKLNLNSTPELVRYAIEFGLVD